MMYESAKVGRYTVNVVYDDYCSLSHAVNDEPVMIFERRDGEILDQSKLPFPPRDFLRAIDESDSDEQLAQLLDLQSWGLNELHITDSGRYRVQSGNWCKPRYFATQEKAIAAMFRAEYGRELSDLKVEQFSRGDSREVYYLCFWQSEFDAYCGGKDCRSSLDSCKAIIDGEVYGFSVEDEEGDILESVWGFIGDAEYCMGEGKAAAEWLESKACEIDAAAMQESRPDMYQQEGV